MTEEERLAAERRAGWRDGAVWMLVVGGFVVAVLWGAFSG